MSTAESGILRLGSYGLVLYELALTADCARIAALNFIWIPHPNSANPLVFSCKKSNQVLALDLLGSISPNVRKRNPEARMRHSVLLALVRFRFGYAAKYSQR